MDFVKRHLFLIVCGVMTIGGITLGVTGLRAMPAVVGEMDAAKDLYQQLNTLRSVNKSYRKAEQDRIDAVLADRKAVFDRSMAAGQYKPLVAEVFPDGGYEARRIFRDTYREELHRLFGLLRPIVPPTKQRISDVRQQIEVELLDLPVGVDSDAANTQPTPEVVARTGAGVLTHDGAMVDAIARANIAAARGGYCYAVDIVEAPVRDFEPSLDYYWPLHAGKDVDPVPELMDCWWAQVGLWIQQDIVDSIVALNEEAARAELDADGTPWVGILPVKELTTIRFSDGYILSDAEPMQGHSVTQDTVALPPGNAEMVFTGSASNDLFDVVQFTVKLVMDQRDIGRLIDRICSNRLHTVLQVSFTFLPDNRTFAKKVYGPEPAVRVLMDFETIMLGEQFRKLMPDTVLEDERYDHLPPRPQVDPEASDP